jgi:hypothetical protein
MSKINHKAIKTIINKFIFRGTFIFGGGNLGGNKRLSNVRKLYCQCQISHKRRKKGCLGEFKFSLNR